MALPVADGTILVLDVAGGMSADARVLARLAADEPSENAQLVCDLYLADESKRHCRTLSAEDLDAGEPADAPEPDTPTRPMSVRDRAGRRYEIRRVCGECGLEVRWTRSGPRVPGRTVLSLRDVVAAVEAYEPASSITARALAELSGSDPGLTRRLWAESNRLAGSTVVLNRGLREAVQRQLRGGETMSQIALRCGRVKRDHAGACSGETSWLARRVGLMAEAGRPGPTPWIHIHTLALIARDGLGLNPSEVEL